MTRASPRPWKVWGNEIAATDSQDFDDIVIGVLGKTLGLRSAPHYVANQHDVIKANAALIVKCVNNHDALVAALEAMTNAFGPAGGDGGESLEYQKQQSAAHAAAIKLLEELKG